MLKIVLTVICSFVCWLCHACIYVCMYACQSRGMQDREGLRSFWQGKCFSLACFSPSLLSACYHLLTSSIHDVVLVTFFIRTDVAVDEGVNLVKNLTSSSLFSSQKDITNLVFYGDSISSQLVQALVCDLLRAGDY